ncbi:hypothetical protein KAR91_29735 [Candidatus Pacearchaeota archaeon]|nr:hypothetical protein [Candidatus Pacearchaeota archaeon]
MVKIDLQIRLSRETIKIILEEMFKQAMTDKDRRRVAAQKGWETRRKKK